MTVYDVELHKQIVKTRLTELNYDNTTIQTWIDFIE